jgi:hypothetical protein
MYTQGVGYMLLYIYKNYIHSKYIRKNYIMCVYMYVQYNTISVCINVLYLCKYNMLRMYLLE